MYRTLCRCDARCRCSRATVPHCSSRGDSCRRRNCSRPAQAAGPGIAARGGATEDRIRVVLAHELAHVARGDWLVQISAEVVRCVYWFNPLLWMACTRLRYESEHACDNAVMNVGVESGSYATHLLELARAFGKH